MAPLQIYKKEIAEGTGEKLCDFYSLCRLYTPVWETAVHLAVAGGVFAGIFCAVLFPTRCLG